MSFKREIFRTLEKNYTQVFNDANLTEDYELGLRLFKLGYKVSYVNLLVDKTDISSRIATGEYFPNNFWSAVRQRSRWTAGICFQNWKMHKWGGSLKNGALVLAVALGRDGRASADGGHEVADGLGIVAPVGDQIAARRQPRDQLGHDRLVRSLAWGEHDAQRQAEAIDRDIDLGGQSSTRTTDGVIRAPFLPPAACWWARTIELSMRCNDCGERAASASNTPIHTPAFAHRLNRLYALV